VGQLNEIINYERDFIEVREIIRRARFRALKSVNRELIDLYWSVGEYLSKKVEDETWGKGVVKNLSDFLRMEEPDLKGFSAQNLWRMKQFYETYCDHSKLSSLMRELSWTNNIIIMSKTKSIEEKEFYISSAIKEQYTTRELARQIDACVYERQILSHQNVSATLTQIHPSFPVVFKDKYVLDFLNLPHDFSEKDLQKAIVENLKHFILEFGKDFAFVGEEYRLQVGNHDYYIDLLFYHRGLRCLVALELKITEFKPEYLGKVEFYLEALDRDHRKEHENPSVGVILCKGKDDEVVEYALSRALSPTMIAEYETKLIPKSLLEQKLREFSELVAGELEYEEAGD
jgi:predicted nuclease of restriction endonuclease-like (RecB) superfamily